MQQLKHIESTCHLSHFENLLLSFYFLAIQENLYMICLYLDLYNESTPSKVKQLPLIDSSNTS